VAVPCGWSLASDLFGRPRRLVLLQHETLVTARECHLGPGVAGSSRPGQKTPAVWL
jgi:hypothetical protein